jgi:hypothetical protein
VKETGFEAGASEGAQRKGGSDMNASIACKTNVIAAVLICGLTLSWMIMARLWNRVGFQLLRWQTSKGFEQTGSKPRLIRVTR